MLGYTARSRKFYPMPKLAVFFLSLIVIILTAAATLVFNTIGQEDVSQNEIDSAVNQTMLVYRQKKATGEDISKGPCLSDAVMPGWVADLVHNPRLPIDDLPENQCGTYLEGRAKHIVELDLEGNLVRAK